MLSRLLLRVSLCLVCLLAGARGAHGDDEKPKPPPTPEEAADEVVKAAGNGEQLLALIARDRPDPWLVAEALCVRGEVDAAEAFAAAGARPAVKGLAAYVRTKGAALAGDKARPIFDALKKALDARDTQAVLAATESLPEPLDTVTRVRVAVGRAVALQRTRKLPETAQLLLRAGRAAQALGWQMRAARLYQDAGRLARMAGMYDLSVQAVTAMRALDEQQGNKLGMAIGTAMLASLRSRRGDYDGALAGYKQALEAFRALGHKRNVATTLGNMGVLYDDRGEFAQARAHHEAALKLCEEIGDKHGMARAVGNLGNVERGLGNHPAARDAFERALKMNEALAHKPGITRETGNIGRALASLGNQARALSYYKRGLRLKRELGDAVGALRVQNQIALAYVSLGKYADALALFEEVIAAAKAIGHKNTHARTLGNLASLQSTLGDNERALASMQEVHALLEAMGDQAGAAMALQQLGAMLAARGELDAAREHVQRALEAARTMGDKTAVNVALGTLAGLMRQQDPAASIPLYTEAIREAEVSAERGRVASLLIASADAHARTGDTKEALAQLERGMGIAQRLRATPLLVRAMSAKAQVLLQMGDARGALYESKTALRELEELLGGLGEEQSASARAAYAEVFALGTAAATRLGRTDEALRFLESGRAGALLESLGGRQALRWTDMPEELAEARARAQAEELQARRAYATAMRSGKLKSAVQASKRLSAAREALRSLSGRFQREAKRAAGLFYPRAAPLDEIQSWLREDQALVLYGLSRGKALAVVIRRDADRIVDLGSERTLLEACGALQLSDVERDATKDLARARALLVAPLKLAAAVKTVLISPEGALGYVPFGALFDRAVALTPSGTTHALLAEERRAPGTGILALGDPDYAGRSKGATAVYVRGRKLSRLPASRTEAEAVGDTVLVGAKASEEGFRAALKTRERWRAVHFACHGLIDPENPTLSSLALTATAAENGFLTAVDVLRMNIPADLAVLSACETGTGRIVKGEGIVGLTRSFMYAGAPRVICSLWKVDDEATQALMRKFYEVWNPRTGARVSTAEALRAAQQHVRAQKKWTHPYYWAAWVLWGLPD